MSPDGRRAEGGKRPGGEGTPHTGGTGSRRPDGGEGPDDGGPQDEGGTVDRREPEAWSGPGGGPDDRSGSAPQPTTPEGRPAPTATARPAPREEEPSRPLGALHRSSVGKKVLMAVTGIVLFLFVFGHMIGNLKVLQGPEAVNGYAEWLREVGYPMMPNRGALWTVRIVLLLSVGVHVWAAFALWAGSRRARKVGYRKSSHLSFSYASRTMRWGGVIIVLFVVYHLLHFTTGHAHADFVEADVYHNFVVAFSNPLVFGAYLVAQLALAFHLHHGIWSLFQTLGWNHPRWNRFRRPLAVVLAWGIFAGFMLPPVLVLLGVLGEVAAA